jgi:TonB family protein
MKKNIAAFFLIVLLPFIFTAFAGARTNVANGFEQTNTTKLKIVKKPIPRAGRCSQSSGLAVVRVTFDKSGIISGAEIFISSVCDNFDNNALKAARAIEFEPQVENGEAVTVSKQVEYKYVRF